MKTFNVFVHVCGGFGIQAGIIIERITATNERQAKQKVKDKYRNGHNGVYLYDLGRSNGYGIFKVEIPKEKTTFRGLMGY